MADMPTITVQELKERRDAGENHLLLDVREQNERDFAHIGGQFIPLGELPDRMDELDADENAPVYVYCRSGGRSAKATAFLRQQGLDAYNIAGGINAWSREVDGDIPSY